MANHDQLNTEQMMTAMQTRTAGLSVMQLGSPNADGQMAGHYNQMPVNVIAANVDNTNQAKFNGPVMT